MLQTDAIHIRWLFLEKIVRNWWTPWTDGRMSVVQPMCHFPCDELLMFFSHWCFRLWCSPLQSHPMTTSCMMMSVDALPPSDVADEMARMACSWLVDGCLSMFSALQLDDIRCVILMSSIHLSDGVLRCCHTDPELDAPIGQLALIDVW